MSILSEEFKSEIRWQARRFNHGIRRAWYVLTTTKAQRAANYAAAQKRLTERMRALLNDPERSKKIVDSITAHNALLNRMRYPALDRWRRVLAAKRMAAKQCISGTGAAAPPSGLQLLNEDASW